MWLFTTAGFFSIVRDRNDASRHHLRARCREDLENLRALVPDLPPPVASHPGSDYTWRILCPASLLPQVLTTLGSRIGYANFKSEVATTPGQQDKLPAYHKIWAAMAAWGADHCG
jgi:hypothetical protein